MENFLDTVLLNKQIELIGLGEMNHGFHAAAFKSILESTSQIKGLFLEDPIDYQSSVDNYLETGKFDQHFEDLLSGGLKEGKDFRETKSVILDYARNRKIPAICIDSSKVKDDVYSKKSKYSSTFLKGGSRDEDMFTNVIEMMGKRPGIWCIVAHAAHLDTSFDMRQGDPSFGKRLREKLGEKYFNVCLLNIPKFKGMKYFIGRNLDTELMSLLEENNLGFLIEDNKLKGFDALVIHP